MSRSSENIDWDKIEQIYASGELTVEELGRVREKFIISCKFCKSSDIAIMTETDDDGYCESCSSPYARATIKCKQCGQGVSIR